MRDSVKFLTEFQKDCTHYLAFIHLAAHIIKGDQITKTGLSFDEFMVSMLENSFVL